MPQAAAIVAVKLLTIMHEDIAKENMVGVARIELATPAMSTQCSTTELYAHSAGASSWACPIIQAYFSSPRLSLTHGPSPSTTRSLRWKGLDRIFAHGLFIFRKQNLDNGWS